MCPGLYGVGFLDFMVTTSAEGAVSVPKRYPEEFRRKVLDMVAAGRPIAQIAADLGISDQTIYGWRKQELIDTGQLPGLNRAEQAELSAANKRIGELETGGPRSGLATGRPCVPSPASRLPPVCSSPRVRRSPR